MNQTPQKNWTTHSAQTTRYTYNKNTRWKWSFWYNGTIFRIEVSRWPRVGHLDFLLIWPNVWSYRQSTVDQLYDQEDFHCAWKPLGHLDFCLIWPRGSLLIINDTRSSCCAVLLFDVQVSCVFSFSFFLLLLLHLFRDGKGHMGEGVSASYCLLLSSWDTHLGSWGGEYFSLHISGSQSTVSIHSIFQPLY